MMQKIFIYMKNLLTIYIIHITLILKVKQKYIYMTGICRYHTFS